MVMTLIQIGAPRPPPRLLLPDLISLKNHKLWHPRVTPMTKETSEGFGLGRSLRLTKIEGEQSLASVGEDGAISETRSQRSFSVGDSRVAGGDERQGGGSSITKSPRTEGDHWGTRYDPTRRPHLNLGSTPSRISISSTTSLSTEPPEPEPPSYYASTFPGSYNIGSKRTGRLLVLTDHLSLHLRLMGHFWELRRKVEEGRGWNPNPLLSDGRARWAWFVHLAVERFSRWVCSLTEQSGAKPIDLWVEEELPPIDVLMVWHSYLLNPARYAEDIVRLPQLRHLHNIFHTLLDISSFVDSKFRPSLARMNSWWAQTRTHFDPIKAASSMIKKVVHCPVCDRPVEPLWLHTRGTGYAQKEFNIKCPGCSFIMTRKSLAAAKFAEDLAQVELESEEDNGAYLAGTLHTPTNPINKLHARQTTHKVLSVLPILHGYKTGKLGTVGHRRKVIIEALSYSIFEARGVLVEADVGERLMETTLMAYTDDRPFSIDLVGAVVRQGSFIAKLYELGWMETRRFDMKEDGEALPFAVARYHAFLDLVASSPSEEFVPTIDIDLAWHTHMLIPWQYASDCMEFVGRYVDHEDKVGNSQLSLAFDETCRAWKVRFSVPYMHCGCPLPGDTLGVRLSQTVTSTLTRLSPQVTLRSHLHPPPNHLIYSATHPSDHNAVYALIPNPVKKGEDWSKRKVKAADRRERDHKMYLNGRMSGDAYLRGQSHLPAFEVPVEMDCDRREEIGLASAGNFR
ncbi:hypothetical protein JAAARDRAFT_73757 [Jaapia argillacea MUCL 33604]|uniref:Uncharacterized protein n=1 Tax=Jaapia argillacea MUCL 33604 TaxID=933084 RepID=A0A067PLF4_9AGAM|nr:hypothetical protein JAAARDRAFT_73757 [Jaapia argillacea MUCL 33604]